MPTGPAPFARQTLDRESLFDLTPFDCASCRSQWDEPRYEGLHTPPSMRGSILFPSALGGGNWDGAAFDPQSNTLYVNAENLATRIRVVKKEGSDKDVPAKHYLTRPLVGTPCRVEGELFTSSLGKASWPCRERPGAGSAGSAPRRLAPPHDVAGDPAPFVETMTRATPPGRRRPRSTATQPGARGPLRSGGHRFSMPVA